MFDLVVPGRRPVWVHLTLGICLFACYLAVATTSAYVGDDWTMLWNRPLLFQYDLGSGRWMSHVLRWVFADAAFMPALTIMLFCVLIAHAGLLISDLFGLADAEALLLTSLLATLPFFVETVSFNLLHITVPFSILLAVMAARLTVFAADVPRREAITALSLAVLLLILSASTYQTAALVYATVLMFVFCRRVILSASVGAFSLFRVGSVAVLLGGIGYFVVNRSIQVLTGQDDIWSAAYNVNSGYVLAPDALMEKLVEVGIIWRDFLFGHLHAFYPISKYTLLILPLGLLAIWSMAARRDPLRGYPTLVLMVVASLLIPFLLFVVREVYPVRYNNLFPMGFVLGLASVLFASSLKNGLSKRVVMACLALTVASNIVAHNVIAHGKRLTFVRDIAISTRIIAQIESELTPADIGRVIPIYLHGKTVFNERTLPFGDSRLEAEPWQKYFVTSAAECSIYACQSGRLYWVMRLVGSDFEFRALGRRLTPEEREVARAAPYWPLAGSVFRLGDFFVVKFHRG